MTAPGDDPVELVDEPDVDTQNPPAVPDPEHPDWHPDLDEHGVEL